MGSSKLAVGHIQLTSEITREHVNLVFAVLHLGGWDFHCCIQPFSGRQAYSQIKDKLLQVLSQGSAAQTILTMTQTLGDQTYSLQDLFPEERHRIMRLLSRETLTRLDQLYTQVYRDNYGVLMAFHRDHLDVPQELQVAAEIAISHRAILAIRGLERETSDLNTVDLEPCLNYLAELEAIATEADSMQCHLNLTQAKQTFERLILRSLWSLLEVPNPETIATQIRWIERLIGLGDRLHLGIALDRAQELFVKHLYEQVLPQINAWKIQEFDPEFDPETSLELDQLRQILQLGQTLVIDVEHWLAQLA
jgi:alpha-amylase/alpha-mannosidase (GH57 family)